MPDSEQTHGFPTSDFVRRNGERMADSHNGNATRRESNSISVRIAAFMHVACLRNVYVKESTLNSCNDE